MLYIVINDEVEYFMPLKYKDIKKDKYEISNYGNIRISSTGKILKTFDSNRGYKRIGLSLNNGKRKNFSIHVLVADRFCLNPNPSMFNQVNHIDADKSHNYYKNLEWVDQSMNIKHAYDTGIMDKGLNHHLGKYNDDVIHKICRHLEEHDDIYTIVSDVSGIYNIDRASKTYKRWRAFIKKLRQKNFRKNIVDQYNF